MRLHSSFMYMSTFAQFHLKMQFSEPRRTRHDISSQMSWVPRLLSTSRHIRHGLRLYRRISNQILSFNPPCFSSHPTDSFITVIYLVTRASRYSICEIKVSVNLWWLRFGVIREIAWSDNYVSDYNKLYVGTFKLQLPVKRGGGIDSREVDIPSNWTSVRFLPIW